MNPKQVAAIAEEDKEKASLGGTGAFQGAHIAPADNGYSMEVMHAPKSPTAPPHKPHVTVHKGRNELLAHLNSVLAKHEGKKVKVASAPAGMNLIRPAGFSSTHSI